MSYAIAVEEHHALADGTVDLVTVAQPVHWFDREMSWRAVQRVLVPGGVPAVWTYELAEITPAIDAAVLPWHRDTLRPCWPSERTTSPRWHRRSTAPCCRGITVCSSRSGRPNGGTSSRSTVTIGFPYTTAAGAGVRHLDTSDTGTVHGLPAHLVRRAGIPQAPRRRSPRASGAGVGGGLTGPRVVLYPLARHDARKTTHEGRSLSEL